MILGLLLLLASSPAPTPNLQQEPATTSQPNWEADLQRRHDALIAHNGPGTDIALRDRLLALGDADQAARGMKNGAPTDSKQLRIATNLAEVDKNLTEQLKQIVADKGWPTITMVGIQASNAAMLMLTHTRDHEWQRSLLPQLEGLADAGKIDGSQLAVVIDKELVASGQLQRYGSQFKLVNSEMAMYAVEDPAGLDHRRASVFLPPMDVYRKTLMDMYHFKISNQIVAPTLPKPPAAQ